MYKKILVPLDGSNLAEAVIPHINVIAQGCNTPEVCFVTVWKPFEVAVKHSTIGAYQFGISDEQIAEFDKSNKKDAEKYLQEVVQNNKIDNVKIKTVVLSGNPPDVIAKYAEDNDFDLIVIATHGRSGVSRLAWGSTADRILRSACVPVFMVRPPGCLPGF